MIDPSADAGVPATQDDDNAPGADTVDVRSGPEVHHDVLALLPLLGVWRGEGQGDYPTMDGFAYGQEIRFFHDGRPFLGMESKTWILDAEGKPSRLANREVGWWRPGKGDDFDVVLTDSTGIVEVYVGQARTTTSWELTSDLVARIPSAPDVTANHRLYGIVEGDLMYAVDMAAMGQPLQAHISARLKRVA
ncbi:uncharacterized protein DUF1794 [Antricoccus suffuscus]|uniref:Peroxynitrite isomerase n=1 Tax=Antricoccus suffuscus TaxID=1629062 RepID=A0A2T0YYQ1_9ACTN|nr:FABP family protein [Antricoccus suffuscus]PRZ29213.1 uncharacterized protein DUF1794 [Antricoccus suffuscus]